MTRYNVKITFGQYGWDVDEEHYPVHCYFGSESIIVNCRLPYKENALFTANEFLKHHVCLGSIDDGGFELRLENIEVIEADD